jgi:adenylate cyclase
MFMDGHYLGLAELAQGRYDTSIEEYQRAVDAGYLNYVADSQLAAALALDGKMEEARTALAEARRLNPKLTVKWMIDHNPSLPPLFDGLRKAGLAEE